MSDLPVSGGQWVGFDIEEALTLADYDPTVYPLPEPARGTRGPGEPVAPRWEDRAACLGQTEVMFPALKGASQWQRDYLNGQAKAICATCPVFDQCHAWVMTQPVEVIRAGGVWAGMTRQDYEQERRRARQAAA